MTEDTLKICDERGNLIFELNEHSQLFDHNGKEIKPGIWW